MNEKAAARPGGFRIYQTVSVGGVRFTLCGRFERSASVGGRHFYAHGSNSRGYSLFEHDRNIVEHGSCQAIGRKFERLLDSQALAAEIRRLVETGETLPEDCRPPWKIDETRFRANEAALTVQRSAGA